MESILPYLIWGTLILTGIAALTLAVFAVRSLMWGKVTLVSLLVGLVPVVVVVLSYLITGTWTEAFIVSALVMLAIGAVSLLLSGVRSLFNF